VWFKPFFDPRDLCFFRVYIFVSVSGGQPLWSSLGVVRRFVVVDAAFVSYGRLSSQIILEAVSFDIRVAVSIWLFSVAFYCYFGFFVIWR